MEITEKFISSMEDVQGLPLDDLHRSNEYKNNQNDNIFRIDMNNSEYDTHISLVYIRNVRPNAVFDFSKCDYKLKAEYIKEYMTTDIEYEIIPLVSTVQSILFVFMNDYEGDVQGILTREEIVQFINENIELLNIWSSMIVSLPYFIIKSFKIDGLENNPINIDIELQDNDYIFGKNVYFILHNELLNELINSEKPFTQYNFINLFNDSTHKLIRSCEHLYLTQMLYSFAYENCPDGSILGKI